MTMYLGGTGENMDSLYYRSEKNVPIMVVAVGNKNGTFSSTPQTVIYGTENLPEMLQTSMWAKTESNRYTSDAKAERGSSDFRMQLQERQYLTTH